MTEFDHASQRKLFDEDPTAYYAKHLMLRLAGFNKRAVWQALPDETREVLKREKSSSAGT